MTADPNLPATPPTWSTAEGRPIACLEKIKVLSENYAALRQIAEDALEDALLMGCSKAQLRAALHALVDALHSRYGAARHEAYRDD